MTRLPTTDTEALDRITRIMPELALDHDQRKTLVRHLDRASVPQLMRRKPAPYTGGGGMVQCLRAAEASQRRPAVGPWITHTARPDWQLAADFEPRVELLPSPSVHADFAPHAAFATPD